MAKFQPWEIVLKDRFLKSEKRENPYAMAFMGIVVVLLCLLLVVVVFFQLCIVDGQSMENTLYDGDHVLLAKKSFTTTYKHGDIVVISKGEGDNQYNIIKRVIGIEGDTLQYRTVNGVIKLFRENAGTKGFIELDESSYVTHPMEDNGSWQHNKPDSNPFIIGEDMVYVLGDNRNNSSDSRKDGSYFKDMVYGKMVYLVEKGGIIEKILKLLYHDILPTIKDS